MHDWKHRQRISSRLVGVFLKNLLTRRLFCYIVSYTSNEPINRRGESVQQHLTDERSIYLQIAEMLETDILRGILAEEERVPSTNELAALYTINPATAAKGINRLVDDGIVYKKRGIGMFVAKGAADVIRARRRQEFYEQRVTALLSEAESLGITKEELIARIQEEE